MPRKYRHIKDYEKELIEYIEQGHTLRETGEKFGFEYKEIKDFKTRYNRNQKKLAAGIEIKPKGRPRKNQDGSLPPSIQHKRNVQMLWRIQKRILCLFEAHGYTGQGFTIS